MMGNTECGVVGVKPDFGGLLRGGDIWTSMTWIKVEGGKIKR